MNHPQPICVGCGALPAELSEYTEPATELNITPDEYVRREEGTYNSSNGHFLCTDCYIRANQPTGERGRRWIAP